MIDILFIHILILSGIPIWQLNFLLELDLSLRMTETELLFIATLHQVIYVNCQEQLVSVGSVGYTPPVLLEDLVGGRSPFYKA